MFDANAPHSATPKIDIDYVREAYAYSGEGLDFKRVAYERMDEFDRWLADVKAEAWDEGLAEGAYRGTENLMFAENPYRTDDQ